MATYRLPKPDGSYMGGIAVKDGMVYAPSGKKLGPVKDFPDLETADGTKVETPVPVLIAPATDDKGNVRPENIAPFTLGDTRTNVHGIVQKGMTLGGIKEFNEQYGLKVADASKLFNLNGSNGQTGDNSNDLSVGDAKVMGKPLSESLPIKKGGATETVITAEGIGETTPYKLGQTDNPQNGVSPVADAADHTRALGMKPFRGSERQRQFANRPGNRAFGGEEPSDESLVSPMYRDKARNAYRTAYLNSTAKGPMGVSREASAAIGVIRTNDGGISIKDGDGYRTYTGDKPAREVAFDLGGGQKGYDKHAGDFETIGVPDEPVIKPDDEQTPATLLTEKDMRVSGQEFADLAIQLVKKK